MRIVKNKTFKSKNDKILKIAYSICGEGHGHYGRNIEILNHLTKALKNCEIKLYVYGDTWNIFYMDKNLPKNIILKKIPGFRYIYKKEGVLKSLGYTLTNLDNWHVFLKILKLDFLYSWIFPVRKLFAKIFNMPFESSDRYYMKYFDEFDFAISDLEPLLPRVADIRKKPFLTLDNQHAMLYFDIDKRQFNVRERLEHLFAKISLKVYHPISELSIVTSFFKLPIKKKYKDYVEEVGPLIRNNLIKRYKEIKNEDYILVYAHKVISDKLFLILTKMNNEKFVVFTTDDFERKDFPYKREWIKYFKIDPDKFIDYIIKCKAVISTAGNTLISEAVFLKKPFFAIALQGNFEQPLNLYMLKKSGWGDGSLISNFKEENLRNFIDNLKKYQDKLKHSDITDNTDEVVKLIIKKINNDIVYN
jgi:uncharacterized protein (TIGR00661 family)